MRAFHNSRDIEYRTPYGAVTPGCAVTLKLDVWDLPGASATLRTWTDSAGETCYPMEVASTGAEAASAAPTRFQVEIAPQEVGIVWYHFIITDAGGASIRYGAKDGRFGGEGQLRDWEPPSFSLSVCDPSAIDDIVKEIFDGTNPMILPSTEAVVGFLRNETTARELSEMIETLRENCPAEAFQRSFDLLGSYAPSQLFALLAGAPAVEAAAPVPPVNYHRDMAKGGLAKGRLWCACLVQMLATLNPIACDDDRPGPTGKAPVAPTIPEGHEDADCEAIVENALDIHNAIPLFATSKFRSFAANDDVFGFWRTSDDGTAVCVLLNASLHNAYDIPVPLVNEAISDVLGGYGVRIVDAAEVGEPSIGTASRYALAHLYQLGSAVLYFHPEQRLGQLMEDGLGVLAHITSLPMDDGEEDEPADEPAATAVEPAPETATAPVSETAVAATSEPAESAAPETDPDAVDDDPELDEEESYPLPQENPGTLGAPAREFVDWLAAAGMRYWQVLPVNPTDENGSPYAGISAFAGNISLLEAGTEDAAPADEAAYQAFCEREADWLEPYACFMAIREQMGEDLPWHKWPARFHSYKPNVLGRGKKLHASAEKWRRVQFEFERQWKELRAYANERGIQIIGDMPIYVSGDSADVWANPGIFQLNADGEPDVVAGCPPDAFSVDGQIWGNPVYDWAALEQDGYAWWLRRLERALDLYDVVRLDHFIGFSRYYSIPVGEKAVKGSYRPGPGYAFFRAAYQKFGPLPIIAEDLGMITPAVRTLVAACGFPGMDIVQFVDGNDPLSGYQPRPEKVAYTGTHDNQTLVGYVKVRYPELDAQETAQTLMEELAVCTAPVAVLPLQDILGLDDSARMNIPGTKKGNWVWQAKRKAVEAAAETAAHLVQLREESR